MTSPKQEILTIYNLPYQTYKSRVEINYDLTKTVAFNYILPYQTYKSRVEVNYDLTKTGDFNFI